jgi:hypothetical protein
VNVLKEQILMRLHTIVIGGEWPESRLKAKCSTHSMVLFLGRSRRGRCSRRPALDNDDCFEFLVSFRVSRMPVAASSLTHQAGG